MKIVLKSYMYVKSAEYMSGNSIHVCHKPWQRKKKHGGCVVVNVQAYIT